MDPLAIDLSCHGSLLPWILLPWIPLAMDPLVMDPLAIDPLAKGSRGFILSLQLVSLLLLWQHYPVTVVMAAASSAFQLTDVADSLHPLNPA